MLKMNKHGDTPVWTIIVFGIIAIVVLVLAVTFLGNTSTAGGEKVGSLFGLAQIPERAEPKYGDSTIGNSCSVSSDCIAGLACISDQCIVAQSNYLVVSGKNNCASDRTEYFPHSASEGGGWCFKTQEGFTYQVEYSNGFIYDDVGDSSAGSAYVRLEIQNYKAGAAVQKPVIVTPPLPTGLTPYEANEKIKTKEIGLTYLAPYSIHIFEGGPYVCGWFRDPGKTGCDNNGGKVTIGIFQQPLNSSELKETESVTNGETTGGENEGASQGAGID